MVLFPWARTDCTLPILKPLSCLFILFGIIFVVECPVFVCNHFHKLLIRFCISIYCVWTLQITSRLDISWIVFCPNVNLILLQLKFHFPAIFFLFLLHNPSVGVKFLIVLGGGTFWKLELIFLFNLNWRNNCLLVNSFSNSIYLS